MSDTGITIGAASKATGVSAKAIRQYEALELIPPVVRRGTYRLYQPTHIQAISLIRQAQMLGFTLAELKQLGKDDCTPDWPRFLQHIDLKRQAIRKQMDALKAKDQALNALRQNLEGWIDIDMTCDDIAQHLQSKAPTSS